MPHPAICWFAGVLAGVAVILCRDWFGWRAKRADYLTMIDGAKRAGKAERLRRDALRTAAERDRAAAGALLLLATVEYEGNLG